MLLDDCLSAVDSHTGKHIFEEALCGSLAADRTILLVSHSLQLCAPAAALVLHLYNGRMAFSGSGDDYVKTDLYSHIILHSQADDNGDRVQRMSSDAVVSSSVGMSRESSQTLVASHSTKKSGTAMQLVTPETKVSYECKRV